MRFAAKAATEQTPWTQRQVFWVPGRRVGTRGERGKLDRPPHPQPPCREGPWTDDFAHRGSLEIWRSFWGAAYAPLEKQI